MLVLNMFEPTVTVILPDKYVFRIKGTFPVLILLYKMGWKDIQPTFSQKERYYY